MIYKTYTAKFINQTNLPVNINWIIKVMEGINKLDSLIINEKEECIITSINGEWFINTYFNDIKYNNKWIINHMQNIYKIGTIKINPANIDEYYLIENDKFNVIREEDKGMYIFKFNFS